MKALYVAHSMSFAFTPSIAELIDDLVDLHPSLASYRGAGAILTLYEVILPADEFARCFGKVLDKHFLLD